MQLAAMPLARSFDIWSSLLSSASPKPFVDVLFGGHEETEDGTTLQWRTALGAPFPMPVPVRVGGVDRRVAVEGDGPVRVRAPDGSDGTIEVDPDDLVLKALAEG